MSIRNGKPLEGMVNQSGIARLGWPMALVALLVVLSGCGSGSRAPAEEDRGAIPESRWDTMRWDQDRWS